MSSPGVLDFSRLLTDIPGDNSAGVDLRTDRSPTSLYYRIKDAGNAASVAERKLAEADEEGAGNAPDWRPVLEYGQQALAEKTKDLEITAFLIEALLRLHTFAGLRDGFHLARELIEKYWDRLYPAPDEDGVASRVQALTHLNGADADGTLLVPIAKVPITEVTSNGALTYAHYQSALALYKITDPKVRTRRIDQGAVSLEIFQKAVADSSPQFYGNLVQDLTECLDEFAKLGAALDKHCAGHAPPSSKIRAALISCLDVVQDVARDKLKKAVAKDEAAVSEGPAGTGAGPGGTNNTIRTRDDAFHQLLKVADFFQRTEPHSPVSFALEQVVRWGRMPLPELLAELIPEEGPRKSLFQRVGIRPPEAPKSAEPAKK